jgi:PPK2 family polyphosphate:nucleotide phosphotransferase
MGDKGGSDWADDPRELLRVDEHFDLDRVDRGATPGWSSGKKAATRFCDDRGDLLSELQERLFAEGRAGGNRSLLVVIQGLDTAGKGGVVRHVMGKVDPQGVALHSFGAPTPEEAEHHFLWRIKKALPKPGLIGVFDRSHYEDVLVARVDELVPPEVWEKRYDEINSFEADLVDSGTTVLKLGLMVSHDEQGLRLMKRLDRPDKQWKYSKNDVPTRRKWDEYQDAYADVFRRTSTEAAPWYVVPADHKWYTRLAATELLTQTLIEIDPTWPTVRWDPEVQRRELVDTMSTRALRTSLKETDRQVKKAVKDDRRVQEEAARALADVAEDDPIAQAETEARTAEAAAAAAAAMLDLQRTRRQKADLVDSRREPSGSSRK